ncbi:MAG: sigma-70 family RNA polymerase sigma factor [Nibricoccus sp.]
MPPDDFSRWIAPVQSRMINCTWRIVRCAADTDDVIQEVLLHVFRRFDEVRAHPNPTALLLRICTQKSLDHLRRGKARGGPPGTLSPNISEKTPSPHQQLANAELRDQLIAFIGQLPPREAEAITLFALEDLGYPDVAEAMNCSEPTVRVLVSRARERFRTEFKNKRSITSERDLTSPLKFQKD